MHKKIFKVIGLLVLFFGIGFAVYFQSLFNGFVWDDATQIISNLPAHSISNIASFFSGGTFEAGGGPVSNKAYYKPIMTTVFALIYTIFGQNAFYFHLIQLLIHITNALLLFYLFRRIFKQSIALVLSLIFLIHPINVEAVVYISGLQETLFMFFGLIGFNILLSNLNNLVKAMLLVICLSLSYLSKETGFLFIPLMLLFEIINKRRNLPNYFLSTTISIIIYGTLRSFRYTGIKGIDIPALIPINQLSFFERVLNIPTIIYFYLKTFFYPLNLSIAQYWVITEVNIANFYLPIFIVIVGLAVIFWWWRILKNHRSNYSTILVFFLIWLLIGLGLHLQLIPLDMTVAERWFYLPEIGLLGIIGVFLQQFNFNNRQIKILALALALAVAPLLSVRTITRVRDWKDDWVLTNHDLYVTQNNYFLEGGLGEQLSQRGQIDQSIVHVKRAIAIFPEGWHAWDTLGIDYAQKKDYPNAIQAFKTSIRVFPHFTNYQNLALVYYRANDFTNAAKTASEATTSYYPDNLNLLEVLALSEQRLGRKDEALKTVQKISALDKNVGLSLVQAINNNQHIDLNDN